MFRGPCCATYTPPPRSPTLPRESFSPRLLYHHAEPLARVRSPLVYNILCNGVHIITRAHQAHTLYTRTHRPSYYHTLVRAVVYLLRAASCQTDSL